jgi:hypothetical protein
MNVAISPTLQLHIRKASRIAGLRPPEWARLILKSAAQATMRYEENSAGITVAQLMGKGPREIKDLEAACELAGDLSRMVLALERDLRRLESFGPSKPRTPTRKERRRRAQALRRERARRAEKRAEKRAKGTA